MICEFVLNGSSCCLAGGRRSATIIDKSLGTLLRFWGVFQFTQVQTLPNVGRMHPEFFPSSNFVEGGGGRTARKCRKGCTILRENRELTEKYEYYSTVPSTFVQDCSFAHPGVTRTRKTQPVLQNRREEFYWTLLVLLLVEFPLFVRR